MVKKAKIEEDDKNEKQRLQWDFFVQQIATLDNAKNRNACSTRAEAFRSILLRFYEPLVQMDQDHSIELRGKDGEVVFKGKIELLLKLVR